MNVLKSSTAIALLTVLLLASHVTYGSASLFFMKIYNDDFKKNGTIQFMGGDQIYGLVSVSTSALEGNDITSVYEFADKDGNVLITINFPSLDRAISWRVPLSPGLLKKNKFIFSILPEKFADSQTHYGELLNLLVHMKGEVIPISVSLGDKNVTKSLQQELTLDLSKGENTYSDWYRKNVPEQVRKANAYIAVFHKVCESKTPMFDDFRTDHIIVKTLDRDSVRWFAGRSEYAGKRQEGAEYMTGGRAQTSFYAVKTDENSFFIYNNGYTFYSRVKGPSDADDQKRCPSTQIENLKKIIQSSQERNNVERARVDKLVITDYVKTSSSKRNDAIVEKQITTWWNKNHPGQLAVKIKFISSNYYVRRNSSGVVLNKTLDAIIVYKGEEGACWMQWFAFGYEHLDDGMFSKDLLALSTFEGQPLLLRIGAHPRVVTIEAGKSTEIACSALEK